ncbi:hypothetical protein KI688_001449 [Linnemannia hyalina]|uniref:JmjC domain-containing protein n=1 Tax=Linnemannia hyalina TaxID=64524 RepID=A0A9P7XT79_9FUNG|nr:hypothetical protein KI688_001449 [Linnemannia hyalina]
MIYDIENVDPTLFPDFHKAKRFTIYQEPGYTLFVPSGWWHQVHNIGDTISINHNWCNGSNLDLLVESMTSDLKEVEREIEHLKDMMDQDEWIETCQKLLLLNSGWDWSTLWNMCSTVRERVRRQQLGEEVAVATAVGTVLKDGVDVKRIAPSFPPPLISQQPPLELTLQRVDAVLDFIRSDPSAVWFLQDVKGLKLQ